MKNIKGQQVKKTSCLLLAMLVSPSLFAADSSVKSLMHNKLESAHGILDALALEDYPKMAHFGAQLRDISKATTWYRKDVPEFLYYAKTLQNSADFFTEQAQKKNLEGVSMGYIRITLACMQCHNAIRGKK